MQELSSLLLQVPTARRQVATIITGSAAHLRWEVRNPSGAPELEDQSSLPADDLLCKLAVKQSAYLEPTDIFDGTFSPGLSSATIEVPATFASLPGMHLAYLVVYAADGTIALMDDGWLVVRANPLTANRPQGLTVSDIRQALWDVCPEENILLDDLEFSDEEIMNAIRRPVDQWNELPPPMRLATVDNFPYRENWLRAACGILLETAGYRKLRNQLPYNGAGLSVDEHANWKAYVELGKRAATEFMQWALNHKKCLNVNEAWNYLSSPYGGSPYV